MTGHANLSCHKIKLCWPEADILPTMMRIHRMGGMTVQQCSC
jgi:hypothetical protein